MHRQLATIQLIKDIQPIPGKDRIVQATLEGVAWTLVTQKDNNFKPGDKVVLFEIDSILPDKEWASFLGVNKRIRSKRFGPILAQGLILPILDIPEVDPSWSEGSDLTAFLGVVEYERPSQGKMDDYAGSFPSHIVSKTEEVLIQSKPKLLEDLRGKPYYMTQKLDGSSTTYLWEDKFVACSRERSVNDRSIFYQIGIELGFDRILKDHPWLVLQGELVGPGIQKNKMGLANKTVLIFNMFDRSTKVRLSWNGMEGVAYDLGITLVPLLEKELSFNYDIPQLVEKSKTVYHEKQPAEGIVVRPVDPIWSDSIESYLSFKVINPDYD